MEAAFLQRPEFDVAYGSPKQRKTLRVSPLRVRQIPFFKTHFAKVIEAIAANQAEVGEPVSIDVLAMIEADRDAILAASAAAADMTVEALSEWNLADFISLAAAVIRVNQDFLFSRARPPSGPVLKTGGEPIPFTWADCIQHLVSANHSRAEVLEYTYAEMCAYSEAVARQRRIQRAENLVDIRVAQYPGEEFAEHYKALANG